MKLLPAELLLGAFLTLTPLASSELITSILEDTTDALDTIVKDTTSTVSSVLEDVTAAINNSITQNGQGYAPAINTCPSSSSSSSSSAYTIDSASDSQLSAKESAYLSLRKTQSSVALQSFLSTYLPDEDVSKYFNSTSAPPTTGLVFAGGGYRAMLTSAGIFNAMDSRTSTGPFKGLLQGIDYVSALSGGTWLVGGSAQHGFADVEWLRGNVWHLEDNLVLPGDVGESLGFLTELAAQVSQKESAGFEVSVTGEFLMLCLVLFVRFGGGGGVGGRNGFSCGGLELRPEVRMRGWL
jgi:lysophospholipase